jgi:hypothetical protein
MARSGTRLFLRDPAVADLLGIVRQADYAPAMARTFKLMMLGALGVWLLTGTSCEDKVCKEALQTCKKESTDQRKECAGNLATIKELRTQLADAEAKVENLGKENDELKAKSAEAETKAKSKGKKGKHKKRGKK